MPFAICCEGSNGACSAEIVEDADGPDVAELTVCGRAVESPVAGSAFPAGHMPRVGFFRAAQLAASAVAVAVPFTACTVEVDAVELAEEDELVELMDEEEFCRGNVLRWPLSILRASLSLPTPKPSPLVFHPRRFGWRDRGAATAVICGDVVGGGCNGSVLS